MEESWKENLNLIEDGLEGEVVVTEKETTSVRSVRAEPSGLGPFRIHS